MAAQLTSPPANEPVCLQDAKSHLKVDHNDEDRLIANLVIAARSTLEDMTGLSLISQNWSVFLDAWPCSRQIELPVWPVQSVSAISVYDEADTAVTVDPAQYVVDLVSRPARIVLKRGIAFAQPSRIANGIQVDLTAGHGVNEDAVPEALRQAVLHLVAHWYDNRSSIQFGTVPHSIPLGVSALVSPFRRVRL